jgi:CBS domain containing-hemolysin-like protein
MITKLFSNLRTLLTAKTDASLREAIEEYIEEPQSADEMSVNEHEKILLSNILQLRDLPVGDVMIPRADIKAIDIKTSQKELLALFSDKQVSRMPVYRETLDGIIGTIHIKDILAALASGDTIDIPDLLTDAPMISPTMPVLDLLLEMRQSRRHMALVVDEYGGIDGLVTIGDVIESIVGEIDDEHDNEHEPEITEAEDGVFFADARVDIVTFEERFGTLLSEEERRESNTLGGLVFHMAGRVPARGEILTHSTGVVFEILDADPRRINALRIRNLPPS